MASPAPTGGPLPIISSPASASSRPYVLCVSSDRPPGSAACPGSVGGGGGGGGAHGRDPIQVLCPYTGSNVTSAHPLRVPSASNRNRAFGVRCLLPVPLSNAVGGNDADATVFVGHGGAGSARSQGGGRDDHAFLLSGRQPPGGGGGGGSNPRWKVRPPEPLSPSPQSVAASPCGRYLAAGAASGTCYLWDWTSPGGDNLVKVWKAHYRPVTCLAFDGDDGATLFTAGEDGVVNAWCTLDLVDVDAPSGGAGSIHPFRTWSEHYLPVTSLFMLPGGGRGSTRLVSSSLDRNLIIMELGGARSSKSVDGEGRTLARMCLPSGLHAVITDSSSSRLYCGAVNGNIYCVDLCRHALHETLDGAGTFVNVNDSAGTFHNEIRGMSGGAMGDIKSMLSGRHVLPASAAPPSSGLSADQGKYVSELRGHAKAVTCLALLDPADLSSNRGGGPALLASGSEDGTLRLWDLRSRSCVRILRPWSSSPGGADVSAASPAPLSPPVTGIVAVPTLSLTPRGGSLAIASVSHATPMFGSSGRRGDAAGDPASLFKPLKRFVRGAGAVGPDGIDVKPLGDCAVILHPRRDEAYVRFWEGPILTNDGLRPRKKTKGSNGESSSNDNKNDKVEIARLKKALSESEAVNERWKAVNNQLVAKLKGRGSV